MLADFILNPTFRLCGRALVLGRAGFGSRGGVRCIDRALMREFFRVNIACRLVSFRRFAGDRLAALDGVAFITMRPAPAMTPMAAAAILCVFIGLALLARFLGEQRLPVGNRNLVVIGMDFRKCQEAVSIAAIIDEGRL